jgi:hypothetical protein
MSKDAFGLDDLQTHICKCGSKMEHIDNVILESNSAEEIAAVCLDCGATIPKKTRRIREEILFTQIRTINSDRTEDINFEQKIPDQESMYGSSTSFDRKIDFLEALDRLSNSIDKKTAKIIELICLEDYSIKDAASEVGLSGWAASMRLKNLSKNKVIRDMFNREK